jgi:hypothetical protein
MYTTHDSISLPFVTNVVSLVPVSTIGTRKRASLCNQKTSSSVDAHLRVHALLAPAGNTWGGAAGRVQFLSPTTMDNSHSCFWKKRLGFRFHIAD